MLCLAPEAFPLTRGEGRARAHGGFSLLRRRFSWLGLAWGAAVFSLGWAAPACFVVSLSPFLCFSINYGAWLMFINTMCLRKTRVELGPVYGSALRCAGPSIVVPYLFLKNVLGSFSISRRGTPF